MLNLVIFMVRYGTLLKGKNDIQTFKLRGLFTVQYIGATSHRTT
jgi:hypothetical protein